MFKNESKQSPTSLSIMISGLIVSICLLFGFFSFNYLYLDGSRVFVSIIGTGNFIFDGVNNFLHIRFFNQLLNLPLVLFAKLDFLNANGLAEVIYFAPKYLFQLFSLYLCFIYLKKRNRLNEFLFPLASYLLLLLPISFFHQGYIEDIIPIVWPLVLTLNEFESKYSYLRYLLLLSLSFTYESVFIVLIAVGILGLYSGRKKFAYTSFGLSLAIFSYLFLIAPELRRNVTSQDILENLINIQIIYFLFGIFIFYITLILKLKKPALFSLCILYNITYLLFWKALYNPYLAPLFKVFFPPILSQMLLLYLGFKRKRVQSKIIQKPRDYSFNDAFI